MLSAAGTVGPLAGSGVAMLIADALPALSHAAARFSTATVTYALGSSTAPLAVSQVRIVQCTRVTNRNAMHPSRPRLRFGGPFGGSA